MYRQLLILAKLVQTRLVFSCGTKHVQLICSFGQNKIREWTRMSICIAACLAGVPGRGYSSLSLSDKLICISGRSSRSPVSSRPGPGPAPRLPVCRLSKVYLFDTKKVDTDTSQKKNKYSLPCHTHHASPHLTSPHLSLAIGRRGACHEKRNPIYLPAPKLDYN